MFYLFNDFIYFLDELYTGYKVKKNYDVNQETLDN